MGSFWVLGIRLCNPLSSSQCLKETQTVVWCFVFHHYHFVAAQIHYIVFNEEKKQKSRLQGMSKGSVSHQWAKHMCVRVCLREVIFATNTDPVCADGRRTTTVVINVMVRNCSCAQRLHEYSPYELCHDALMAQPQSFRVRNHGNHTTLRRWISDAAWRRRHRETGGRQMSGKTRWGNEAKV